MSPGHLTNVHILSGVVRDSAFLTCSQGMLALRVPGLHFKEVSLMSSYWNHLLSFLSIPVPGHHHGHSDLISLVWDLGFSILITLCIRFYHVARVEYFYFGFGHCPISCMCVLLHPSCFLSKLFCLRLSQIPSWLTSLTPMYQSYCLPINLLKAISWAEFSCGKNFQWLPVAHHE